MGLRANVVTKYVCEYEGSSAFNYEAERVWEMLTQNCVDIYFGCGCGCDNLYGSWEINVTDELHEYIAKLGTLPPDEVNEYFDATDSDHQDYTNKYVKEVLDEWVRYSDATSGVIRIQWF